jgi:hypothetical protein
MAITCEGVLFFDIRTAIKGVAGEAISMGESCYVHTDEEIYVVDNGKSDVCHGWALEDAAEGDEVTLVTTARLKVDTAQTVGARLYTGAVAGGSAPSTTHAATGVVVGFAYGDYEIFVNVPTPAADG